MLIENIEMLCKKNNITVAKMLLELGLSNGAFANWKKRGTIPSGDVVVKIAKYFNVSTDYLLGVQNSPNNINMVKISTPTNKQKDEFSKTVDRLTMEEREQVKKYMDFIISQRMGE